MKKIIICFLFIGITGTLSAQNRNSKQFRVTIQNLSLGQPLTPPLVAVHAPGYKIFKVGSTASDGLSLLARDGDTSVLAQELSSNPHVIRTVTGTGVIGAGASSEIIVEANDSRFKLSVVSMLARTNDAIASAKNLSTRLRVGQKYSRLLTSYDAGTEVNTESCEHIPAPPCGQHGTGIDENGIIIPHVGVLGIGDLVLSRDAFSQNVAKVTVERIQ